jgi:hypothetical protein
MEDRGRVREALGRGPPIELVVEDGFDGAVGPGADLDGPLGGGLDARRAKRACEPNDAETGAIALFGMGSAFQDLLAQGRGRRADFSGVFPDALDRPAGVAPSLRRPCFSLSCVTSSPSAASTSARLVKVRRLSRPSSQRSMIRTACSTFALSRGFLGLAGRMAVR